ncbi:unnamed protein product [Candida verbasci]|uniref:Uncharacterized protein n=1 Tax=Candida verbasci TaxID=1227364 RepID=A0A9W4TRT8_9ASCO|nr:unnamed protein product [Candida verbasci]
MSLESTKVRYERLKLVANKALDQSINESLTNQNIILCFPNLSTTNLDVLLSIVSQLQSFWLNTSLDEFELIYKEKLIQEKLNELDEIIYDAQFRRNDPNEKPDFVDELTPLEIIDSNIMSDSTDILNNLRSIHERLQLENKDLTEELKDLVSLSNDKKQSIVSNIEQLQKDVKLIDSTDLQIDRLLNLLNE